MFALVSCNYNESEVVVNTTETSNDAIVDGKVSLSRAISNADFVFKNTEGLGNKARKIKSVDVLKSTSATSRITRASSLDEQDALAYVVNYDNNEGFAILAATTKLPPVISIGDEGNFNTEGFVNFIQNNGASRSGEDINPAQEVQYAIINNSLILPSINVEEQELLGVDTTVLLKCLPLVKTKWNQGWPYNYYSYTSSNEITSAGCVPITGAQTLTSLCYHHNWRPTIQLSETYNIDWYTINRMIFNGTYKFTSGDITDEVLAVASLIRAIGEDVNADYDSTYPYVFASNEGFVNTFKKLGLTNVKFGTKDDIDALQEQLFNMIINKNIPVPTQASCSNASNPGHSFVIDGWLRLEYSLLCYWSNEIIPGVIERKEDNVQHKIDLVHVNFGRNGDNDGYYLPDAFDLIKDEYRDYAEDGDRRSGTPLIYDLNVQYVIYDVPLN